ncbi:DUF4237 domain-containing protein [Bacillus clarus]|uniref:DUF4237 domain-containing protein n=1 Tax=Bacillus clarus TaxID=2338372 RepID=A0A090YB39_9BACI|nr:glycohydrolase toxin TNT-related protein [Bacillus clarus]KFM95689.1 hypothetical protein DJ93_5476 [Bacillus clarus]RFT63506.1 DUF4237 domain-containing protein [Bacillus clarus]
MEGIFDGLNLKSDAKTVELGAGDAERIISEAYKEKLEKWAYPPSKEKYTKYKEIYDNPKYYNQETGDINWPPNNGFEGTPETVKLEEGMLIDRFGGPNGGFFFPAGEPYEARALALHSDEADYYVYRILDDFDVLGGKAEPWFDRPGGATQFVKYHDDGSMYTIQEFIDEEFIELVSVKKGG